MSRDGWRVPQAWWRLLSVGSAAVVLVMALLPLRVGSQWFDHADKVMHAGTFAALTIMALLGWPRRRLTVVGCLAAYGAAIELLQGLTPTRTASSLDLVADVLGIGVGMMFTRWVLAQPRP